MARQQKKTITASSVSNYLSQLSQKSQCRKISEKILICHHTFHCLYTKFYAKPGKYNH